MSSSKSLCVWDWRARVSCQHPCQDLPVLPSHTIHYHVSCLCLKAVFSFSVEVKPEVCASSKLSGPQENTGKFLVAVLQDIPNTFVLRNAGREVDLARMHGRYAHLSLPLMLQRELFWLVRGVAMGVIRFNRSHQACSALTSVQLQLQLQEQKGVAQEQTGDALRRKENRGWVPFLLWLDS